MRTLSFALAAIVTGTVGLVSGGCGGDSSSTSTNGAGGSGQQCYPNETCDAGFECRSQVCVAVGGSDAGDASIPEAGEAGDDGPMIDSGADASDAPVDAGPADAPVDAGPIVDAPRLIAPLSGAQVTSHTPTLKWSLAAGTDGAQIDFCHDRACAQVIATASGTSHAQPPAALSPGVVFWRAHGIKAGVVGANTSPTWQFVVGVGSAPVDTSWGTVPDVNGDGFADAVVGAPTENNSAGAMYWFAGGTTGFPNNANARFANSGRIGSALASGDVNGDGFPDVMVGGQTELVLLAGSASGLAMTPTVTLTGSLSFIGSEGDINGDGYADLIVGVPLFTSNAGAAYVYQGGPNGFALTPTTSMERTLGTSRFGWTVASAGDVNGDGFADVFVGSPQENINGTVYGQGYIYHGSATGLVTTPATTFTGPQANTYFGIAACAGDVNGDGYADIVVAAPYAASTNGAFYVYLGSAAGIATSPSLSVAGTDGNNAQFGYAMRTGDVNGDGYADLLVGAPYAGTNVGAAHLYLGGAAGLSSTAAVDITGPDGSGGYLGYALAVVGDVTLHDASRAHGIDVAPQADASGAAMPKAQLSSRSLHVLCAPTISPRHVLLADPQRRASPSPHREDAQHCAARAARVDLRTRASRARSEGQRGQ